MPIYEYEHLTQPCSLGQRFEMKQSIEEAALSQCPQCHGGVRKYISRIGISVSKSNTDIRDLGFTKLVKRDDGIYENVTRREGESRYMIRDQVHTAPHWHKIISD